MKKIYFLFTALLFLKSFATVHQVTVSNFQFSPATVNAVVGDTIKWVWGSGFHTTTSETVPAGATTWDAPIQSAGQTFSYILTVAGTYTYECTVHPTAMQATLTVSGALPVVLKNFIVSPTKTNGALLSWSTASEQNTDHFEIMRSTDDKSFVKVASIPAKGNSSIALNYSYTDNTLPANNRYIYYYLSIADKDGRKSLSDIKMFTNKNSDSKLIASITPNPVSKSGHLMLQFNSEQNSSLNVQLFNTAGRLVKEDNMAAVTGLNMGHFQLGDIAPGIYTIVFSMDGKKESYKIAVE